MFLYYKYFLKAQKVALILKKAITIILALAMMSVTSVFASNETEDTAHDDISLLSAYDISTLASGSSMSK